jgi:hypothetical protein
MWTPSGPPRWRSVVTAPSRCSSTATPSIPPTGSTSRSTPPHSPWPSPNTTRTRHPSPARLQLSISPHPGTIDVTGIGHLRSTRPPLGDIILGRPSGGGRAGACAVADVVALAGGAFFSQIERQGRRLDIVRRTLAAARGWCGWVGMVGSVGVLDGGGGPPGQVLGQGEVGLGCSGRAGGWPR